MTKTQADTHSLNIFDVLKSISTKQYSYYELLPATIKPKFTPLVVEKWMTGTSDPSSTILVNEFVNPYIFSLRTHPNLLYLLMTTVSEGKFKKYTWPKQGEHNTDKTIPLKITIIKSFYNVSSREAKLYMPLLTNDDIREMAKSLGMDDKEYKEVK